MSIPDLSIIIPAWNCAPIIDKTLTALAAQQTERCFEVIAVDDCSDDATLATLRAYAAQHPGFPLHVIEQAHKGYAAGTRNCGLQAARADLILFLDADIVAEPGLLDWHLDYHLNRPEAEAVVLGHVKIPPEWPRTPFLEISNAAQMWDDLQAGQKLHWSYFFAGNISAKKDFLLSVGGFNPAYFRGEDSELGCRLHERGMQIYYAPEAVGYHHHVRGIDDELRNNQNYGKIFATYYRSGNPHLRKFAEDSWYFERGPRVFIKRLLGFAVGNPLSRPLSLASAQFLDTRWPSLSSALWRLLFFHAGYQAFWRELNQHSHETE